MLHLNVPTKDRLLLSTLTAATRCQNFFIPSIYYKSSFPDYHNKSQEQ